MNVSRVTAEVVRESPHAQPGCPVCGGVMLPQRDGVRCGRCFFALCVGCEPDGVADAASSDLPSGAGQA